MARVLCHWAACLGLLQVGRRSSITWEATSSNCGNRGEEDRAASRDSRFWRTGCRPSATAVRLAWANSLARARLTA